MSVKDLKTESTDVELVSVANDSCKSIPVVQDVLICLNTGGRLRPRVEEVIGGEVGDDVERRIEEGQGLELLIGVGNQNSGDRSVQLQSLHLVIKVWITIERRLCAVGQLHLESCQVESIR